MLKDAVATPPRKKTDRTASGVSTNELAFSAHTGTNDEVFPGILQLYVPEGSKVADVTYGRGVFWKDVDTGRYEFFPSDLKDGTHCRRLPYGDGMLDAVVLTRPICTPPAEPLIMDTRTSSNITIITASVTRPKSTMRRY